MNFKKQIILGVAAVSFFTACSTEEIPSAPGQSSLPVTTHVQLNVRSFGDASRVESSNGYNTLNGYFFSQGKLSLHYVCQVAGEIGHTIELPDSVGTLYFVADPATDFVSQITAQTTEQEFMQLTAGLDGLSACPMTASVQLDRGSNYGNLGATLIRSVARIDAQVLSDNIRVNGITLHGVARNGYYFPQESIQIAAGGTTTLTHQFEEPLTDTHSGIFHLYEQDSRIDVEVEVLVNDTLRTFTATLPSPIRRNHIYTLKITSKGAQVDVNLGVGQWEQGEDTIVNADN